MTCPTCGCRVPGWLHYTSCSTLGPAYPALAAVDKHRRKANKAGSLAELEKDELRAYGEAVALAWPKPRTPDRHPLPAPYRCKNDREIAAMLSRKARNEAIARCGRYSTAKPASENYSQPGWRTDKELIAMYHAAMKEKRNA